MKRSRRMGWRCLGLSFAMLIGCDRDDDRVAEQPVSAPGAVASGETAGRPRARTVEPGGSAPETRETTPVPAEPEVCPVGMARVGGGAVWIGTHAETYDREENPRFRTQLPDFCADRFELSAAEYEACVEAGKCEPAHARNLTCNTVDKGRGNHPINCIDHGQAVAACQFYGKRLPSEVEWEYMARGGKQMLDYPWGDAEPDGHTCWKSAGSCERGSYPPAAFGLSDVVGNVWEWTDSWFGRYPWPESEGRHKVYRGGSWSRRFAKWMRPGLRNRLDPEKWGSHLGVRCVKTLASAPCPYGRAEGGECKFGLDEVDCLDGAVWNGVRCAQKGDARPCLPGTHLEPGHGCVREPVVGKVSHELDLSGVQRNRSPEFDSDCQKNAPGKPHAYRLTGGGHLARNAVGRQHGCKNRDVGVGWNSACCP